MDGITFTVTLTGPLPAKLYGPDINARMAGVYVRVQGRGSAGIYNLRNDRQHGDLEPAWNAYLMQRLTREELDGESS